MRRSFFRAVGILLILAPTSAFAQTDMERAAAREAADSGRAQFDAGRYAEAIDSFSRAQQLVPAPPHLLYLARAQAKIGKLVEARENYLKITRETLPPKSPKAFVEAQSSAEREIEQVEARMPSVTIAVQGAPTKDVSVLMDGATLSSAMVGIPLPVDPGQHVFEAQGVSARSAPVSLTIAEGSKETVMLTLRATAGAGSASESTPLGAVSSTSNLSSEPLTNDTGRSSGSGLRIGSYVAFGVGAVGLGVGTVFLLKYSSTHSDSNDLYNICSPQKGGCTLDQQSAIEGKDSDAHKQSEIGVGGMIVGGVGVAAGVTLLLLSNSRSSSAAAHTDSPKVMPVVGYRSIGLVGQF